MLSGKHGIALVVALTLLIFAVPRLPMTWEVDLATGFSVAWLIFAYLVISANWRMVLQVDRERRVRDEQARRRRWLSAQKKGTAVRSYGKGSRRSF
ncbi:hypothetical protein [Paludifilum halophilum]|uniref:Uncharacterized protein n=1 Tax=Paludifilum halophilum TaxID=1642702 RepID=A0A235B8V7_9BACL|nr:hypothetical protein [Paludifilum halophilum]OYD08429.1 hypothetical protein CHM34_06240 [Paludifilum halophilum]